MDANEMDTRSDEESEHGQDEATLDLMAKLHLESNASLVPEKSMKRYRINYNVLCDWAEKHGRTRAEINGRI